MQYKTTRKEMIRNTIIQRNISNNDFEITRLSEIIVRFSPSNYELKKGLDLIIKYKDKVDNLAGYTHKIFTNIKKNREMYHG